MEAGSLLSEFAHAGRLFVETIPLAFWLAYGWAKEWQGLLGGLLILVAARIFSQGSLRAARIRATAMIRSAQIAAGGAANQDLRAANASSRVEPVPRRPASPENELFQRVEQLRSLIRSAMSTLTVDAGTSDANSNFFCERIALLHFNEDALPPSTTLPVRDLYQRLMAQLETLRLASVNKAPQSVLSDALMQLNTRAREFSSALAPMVQPANIRMARRPGKARA